MANAHDTYRTLAGASPRTGHAPASEAFREARFLLSRVQHQTLSAQPDGFRRQLCGILFAHTLQAFDLPQTYDEPEAWTQRNTPEDRRKAFRTIAVACAVFLFALCCVQLYLIDEILLMLGFIAAAVLSGFWLLARPRPGKERIHLTQRVNLERLDAYLAACMGAIDRDMEAIDLLIPADVHATSDEVLDIAAKVLEIDRAGVEPLPQTLRHAVDALLVQQRITLVEYTPENAPLFQTLPTQRETRTLVPAMLRDQHLIRSGLAILSTATGEEEVS